MPKPKPMARPIVEYAPRPLKVSGVYCPVDGSLFGPDDAVCRVCGTRLELRWKRKSES